MTTEKEIVEIVAKEDTVALKKLGVDTGQRLRYLGSRLDDFCHSIVDVLYDNPVRRNIPVLGEEYSGTKYVTELIPGLYHAAIFIDGISDASRYIATTPEAQEILDGIANSMNIMKKYYKLVQEYKQAEPREKQI